MHAAPTSENALQPPILSAQDLAHFRERGYLRLPQAFPPEAALAIQEFMWQELGRLHGIDRHQPATWTTSWSGLNGSNRHAIYQGIASERLLGAIGELLPHCTWRVPKNWGGFIVSPPDLDRGYWRVSSDGWHHDGGDPYGLFIFTHFGSVRPRCGGTLLLEGSHALIERCWSAHPGVRPGVIGRELHREHPCIRTLISRSAAAGLDFASITAEPEGGGPTLRVVEAAGEPGDAFLCHPQLLHTKPMHHGSEPRFMRGMLLSAALRSPQDHPPA